MPWGFIVIVSAAVALTKFVLFPWMQKHGGKAVNVTTLAGPNVVNDQTVHLSSYVGPTSIYVQVPPGQITESITVDGKSVDIGAAQQAADAAGMANYNMKLDVTKPSGQIVIVTDTPTALGRLDLKVLGPADAATLRARGELRARKNILNYGAAS